MSSLQTDTAFINSVGPILDVDHCSMGSSSVGPMLDVGQLFEGVGCMPAVFSVCRNICKLSVNEHFVANTYV